MSEHAAAPLTVFVSVGTDHHQFNRLIGWADDWFATTQDVRCVVQHGESDAPRRATGVAYLGYNELTALMAESSAIVCHGGPATIMDARTAGLLPLVVPRQPALGEHVDEHQVLFTRRLADLGEIQLLGSYDELAAALDRAVADPDAYRLDTAVAGVDEAVSVFARFVNELPRRRSWLEPRSA